METASERFMNAIVSADRAAAYELAKTAFFERGLALVYEELVGPALVEIGALWERGVLSVAQEHVAAAIAAATVAALYPSVQWPERGPKVVVAAVSGEHHTLGARMFADLLALDGWDDSYLGADTPTESIADLARGRGAVVAALSASTRARLPALRAAVAAIRERAPATKIIVGGRLARELAPRDLGVDAVAASATEGTDEARRWKH
jgi:methanogenic corrinoid protein MtbC1